MRSGSGDTRIRPSAKVVVTVCHDSSLKPLSARPSTYLVHEPTIYLQKYNDT